MTVRRYYTDSYTTRFAAEVAAVEETGGHAAALLAETYFYPTSGGQPHDTGRIGGAAVVDVRVRESDGEVLHLLDAPVAPGPAEATVDWGRRYDHMQQHSGQHILSQAFEQVAGAATIGFHLGDERVSIDLALPATSDAVIADAEALANRIVRSAMTVRSWFPDPEELASLRLRKQPDVQGALRVVAIGDFDLSACGGTHVAQTGEVGLIAVLKAERLKRGTRIEFLAGDRARADYARGQALLHEAALALTCAPAELPEAVRRLQGSLQEARRALNAFAERALDSEAAELASAAKPAGNSRLIVKAWTGRPVDELKGLALRITERPGFIALLASAGQPARLLFARSEDVTADLRPAFDNALTRLGGGKGGGGRVLQGAAASADLETVERALTECVPRLPPQPGQ
jgi:alanyl-tRNA synthetase